MNKEITLRLASEADAAALLKIYAPYVTETPITFETTLPTIEEFQRRIGATLEKFPYYVALMDGHTVGYAYASTFRVRAAYDWTVETTVYIDQNYRGYGIGSKLYSALEATLKTQGVLNMIACIAHPNPPSTAFHETMGFRKVGHFSQCGYKMKWCDVVWLEKHIGVHTNPPAPVIPFPALNQ